MYLGHSLDFSRSHEVIGHVIILTLPILDSAETFLLLMHITSTPSAYKVISLLTRSINYFLTYLLNLLTKFLCIIAKVYLNFRASHLSKMYFEIPIA